jgi:hypothetical protein
MYRRLSRKGLLWRSWRALNPLCALMRAMRDGYDPHGQSPEWRAIGPFRPHDEPASDLTRRLNEPFSPDSSTYGGAGYDRAADDPSTRQSAAYDPAAQDRADGLHRLSKLTWRATQLGAITAAAFAVLFARTAPAQTASSQTTVKPTTTPTSASPAATPSTAPRATTHKAAHKVPKAAPTPTTQAAAQPSAAPATQPSSAAPASPTLAPPTTAPAPAPSPSPVHSTTSASKTGG